MSWFPYVGDPHTQVGENDAPMVGPHSIPTSRIPRTTRRWGMNTGMRMQAAQTDALGVQRFTPDQLFFRDSIANGRWGEQYVCEPGQVADKNLNLVRRYPDGTCDMIGLEANGRVYFDLGGQGARDTSAGRA